MYCHRCGTKAYQADNFCAECGIRLTSVINHEYREYGSARPSVTGSFSSTQADEYATFSRRFLALILDLVIFSFALAVFSELFPGGELFTIPLWWLFHAFMECSEYQATPGKMALGIIVTDLDGNRISFWRSTGRWLGRFLSLFLFIGFIMAAFTEKKQALHDIMAGCLVLNRG